MNVTNWLLFLIIGVFFNTSCIAEDNKTNKNPPSLVDSTANLPTINPLSPPATRSPQDTFFEFLNKSRNAINIIYDIQAQAMQETGLFHTPANIVQSEHAEELLEQAIRTLNLSDIPEVHRVRIGLERALMLKEILERIPLPEKGSIPDQNTTTYNEQNYIQRWEIPNTEIAIVRATKEYYVDEYLFSPETVKRIPEFYAEVKQLPPINSVMQRSHNFYDYYSSTPGHILPPKWSLWLPGWSKNALYLNQTLWQWFALSSIMVILLSSSTHLIRWHLYISRNEDYNLLPLVTPLIISLLLWISLYLIEDILNITSGVFIVVSLLLHSLIFITTGWFIYTFINWVAERALGKKEPNNTTSLLRILSRIIAIISAASVIYFGAQSQGVPIEPLIASFGAFTLAFGLGAQEYFKNVVGGLTLYLDRPVRVGELCEFEDILGTVEEIGLRSTRIRTGDNLLFIIPNSHFSTANIKNLSQRHSLILDSKIGLRYETTHEQLQIVIENLRQYLEKSPWVEHYRVNLSNLGDYSLDISIRATIATSDKGQFLKYQETFLLKAIEIVEVVGTDFAFPSQTLYLEKQAQAFPLG